MKQAKVSKQGPANSHAASWSDFRVSLGLPESLHLREKGKCFDCGEPLQAGACGGWHSRLQEDWGKGYAVEFCCRCAGHA